MNSERFAQDKSRYWDLPRFGIPLSRPYKSAANDMICNILLIEDECLTALDLSDDLTKWGYCVTGVATDLEQALCCAEKMRPDIAIVDISLYGQADGIDVARLLKSRFSTQIVFMTGHSDAKTRALINSVNPAGFLFKPYSPVALNNLLKQIRPTTDAV